MAAAARDAASTLFDEATLTRAYVDSPPRMKAVFDFLADRADEDVLMDELAEGLQRDRRQLGGGLGFWARVRKNRYGHPEPWPFTTAWDGVAGQMRYRLPGKAAEVIRRARRDVAAGKSYRRVAALP